MGSFLSPEERRRLPHAETRLPDLPVPTRMISNGEFTPRTDRLAEYKREYLAAGPERSNLA